MAKNELDPDEIEDNLYFVTEIINEDGGVEAPEKSSVDEMIYGKEI